MLLCFLGVHMFLQNVSKSPANKSSYFLKNLNTKSNLYIICVSPIITICVCIKATAGWEMETPSPGFLGKNILTFLIPFFFLQKFWSPFSTFCILIFDIFPFYFGKKPLTNTVYITSFPLLSLFVLAIMYHDVNEIFWLAERYS